MKDTRFVRFSLFLTLIWAVLAVFPAAQPKRTVIAVSGGDKPEVAALYTAEAAWVTLQAGFTTVQSVGAAIDAAVRDRIAQGSLPGPRVLTSLRQIQDRSGDPDALRALVQRTKTEGGSRS